MKSQRIKFGLIIFFIFWTINFNFCQQKEIQASNERLKFVDSEELPQFLGGDNALLRYMRENLRYPKIAKKDNIEGKVEIQFSIDSSGIIDSPKIVTSLSPECDTEALRVVRKMPKWKPGRYNGKPVKVYFTLPIKFMLNSEVTSELYTFIEQMPQFPGIDRALVAFIHDNLLYPDSAKINKIEGTVTTRFIIDEQGNISSPQVIKGLSPDCDKEAIRILKIMPKWIPGHHNGKDVSVSFTLPIRFKLP